jgi:hypothetical protein
VRKGLRCLVVLAGLLVAAGCSREPAAVPATRALTAAPLAQAGAGPRIALVVGNAAYEASPLLNPARDAALVAASLEAVGFRTQLLRDGDQRAMKRAIQAFGAELERGGPDAVGLFFYAGHGVQLGGRNYLIPVGAHIERDADVEIEAVGADWVIEQMRFARNRLNFIVLDACRNNPFVRSFRSADRGLARMDAPAGVLIAYSTAPGDVAADGEGANSPYSLALAAAIRGSGEPAELMFKGVRDEVRRSTAERQTPWESSSLTGQNFYFARTAAPGAPPAPVVVPDAGVARANGSVTPMPAAAPREELPLFMEDELCRKVVGSWRVGNDSLRGRVTLDEHGKGAARLDGSPSGAVEWDCDAGKMWVTIHLPGEIVHKVRPDGASTLLFGYDVAGLPTTYER